MRLWHFIPVFLAHSRAVETNADVFPIPGSPRRNKHAKIVFIDHIIHNKLPHTEFKNIVDLPSTNMLVLFWPRVVKLNIA